MADVDEIDLRDLRSVVVAADERGRDDETPRVAAQLREALTKRVEAEQAAWVAELTSALDEGRVVRALRLSSRPPKAGVILDPALTARLAEGACASLTADAPADRWAAVLDATAFSPVRLAVKPQSLPEKPSDELVANAKKLALAPSSSRGRVRHRGRGGAASPWLVEAEAGAASAAHPAPAPACAARR